MYGLIIILIYLQNVFFEMEQLIQKINRHRIICINVVCLNIDRSFFEGGTNFSITNFQNFKRHDSVSNTNLFLNLLNNN